jgi:hypothetical protein
MSERYGSVTNADGPFAVQQGTDGSTHIVPAADVREHLPADCWCTPYERVDDGFFFHRRLGRKANA